MTTIKAGTTSTTAFVVDTDSTGNLTLQSGGSNTAVTFDSQTQQAIFTHAVNQPGGFMFRNRIINGDMSIDQRNVGDVQTITAGATAYTVDRWYAYCTGANVTGQRVSGSGNTQNYYRFTGAASVTKIGFGQRIEAASSFDLNNGIATLSADLANSLLTTVTWTAWYANTVDTFGTQASPTRTQIATGTFTVTPSVTRYNTQISIPSAATTGIEIEFSVAAQTSGTWTIGNVQLEGGSAATSFEKRPIGMELSLCQRYYQKSYNLDQKPGTITGQFSGGTMTYTEAVATFHQLSTVRLSPSLRGNPSITIYNPTTGATASLWGQVGGNVAAYISMSNSNAFSIGVNNVSMAAVQGLFAHYVAISEL